MENKENDGMREKERDKMKGKKKEKEKLNVVNDKERRQK